MRSKRCGVELVGMEIHGEPAPPTLGLQHAAVDHERGQQSPESPARYRHADSADFCDRKRKLDELASRAPHSLGRRPMIRDSVLSPAKGKNARRISEAERHQHVVEPESLAVDAEEG